MRKILIEIFDRLSKRIDTENQGRSQSGAPLIRACDIRVLGQMSLLANQKVQAILALTGTGDLDAQTNADFIVKKILKEEILPNYGLVLDDDSHLVWIPPGAIFEPLDAIASGEFPTLVERIEKNGGDLGYFA